jgi:hypothetical protein
MVYNMPTSVLDEGRATLWETYISDPPRTKAKVTFATAFASRKHAYQCTPVLARARKVPVGLAKVREVRDAITNGRGRAAWAEDLDNIATSGGKTINDLAWIGEYDFSGTPAEGSELDETEEEILLDGLKRTIQNDCGHDLPKSIPPHTTATTNHPRWRTP